MDAMTFGKALATLRKELYLSQSKAAERVSVDGAKVYRQYWNRYEAGKDLPSLTTLWGIAKGLNLTLADFEQVYDLHTQGLETDQIIEFRRDLAANEPESLEWLQSTLVSTLTRRIHEQDTEIRTLRDLLASQTTGVT